MHLIYFFAIHRHDIAEILMKVALIDIILGYLYMQTMTIVKGFLLISIEHLPIAGEFRVMVINATFIQTIPQRICYA
jgi:hypothetical protein